MKTAVVIGATGLIGKILVEKLAQDNSWTQVLAIVRKPHAWTHPKIRNLPFNFMNWEDLSMQIKTYAGMTQVDYFCALGTTIKVAGTQEKFRQVDYVAVVEFAKMAARGGANSLFVVSALGSDAQSSNFYLKTKGEMEKAVKSLGIKETYFLKPSLLLGERDEFRLAERIGVLFSPFAKVLLQGPLKKYQPVPARSVAQTMVRLANRKATASQDVENDQIIKLGK